jgi:putative NADH-flavin reductase
MRVTVFGATGPIGQEFLRVADAQGVGTVAFVRSPSRLDGAPASQVVIGDVFDPADVRAAVAGSDCVLIALGLGTDRRTPLYSRGTQTIVDAMRDAGVRRLIVLSEAAYDHHTTGALNRLIIGIYQTASASAIRERRHQDQIVADSGLDWTIVRARVITDRPSAGRLPIRLAPHGKVTSATSRTDLARLILEITTDAATHQHDVYP